MRTYLTHMTIASLFLGMLATVFVCAVPVANAEEVEGIELGDAIKITAEVVAVDKEDRIVTLRGPEGRVVDLAVGEEARNFDQIRVGDDVSVAYYESVALYLGEQGAAPEADAAVVAKRAAKGDKPAGIAIGVVDVSVKIVAIDLKARAVTLELPDGEIVTTPVAEALRSLDTFKVGDTVHARLTKAIAISVDKPQ
jgi:hypothetical protein